MKNKTYKTSILALWLITATIAAPAQLPNFTKVDTGAITQLWGGHISSTCFDMDNDGDLDILAGNCGMQASRDFSVFKNERNGLFVEIPTFVNMNDARNLQSIGDIDNDGDIDLFAGIYGAFSGSSKLYLNDGYGNFQFNTVISLGNASIYPSLIDLNGDSFLDLLLIDRYGKVFYNDGEGEFQGYSLGLLHEPSNIGMQGTSWGDADDDGDMDIYGGFTYDGSVDEVSKNACFLNNGDDTFVKFDETSVIVDDSASANPCANWVDYDNDGDMDLYVLNFTLDTIDGPLNALYENLGNMQFTKHVFEDEMYRNSFKISSVWGDLDNDADLDLYVTVENNVLPYPGGYTSATPYNLLFINDGSGGFTNILDHTLAYEDSHTALMFDHDNDGDLDVLMSRYSWSNDGYNNLFVNEGNDNSWIVLTCEGTASNRSAIGARVQAKCFVNGEHITQTREITPINGHISYANLRVHFGLGDADVIDTLLIRWPSGIVDAYPGVEANQFYRAVEDEELKIDFKATNYIQWNQSIAPDTIGCLTIINLKDHYQFIEGDTVPQIMGDTLTFSVYSNQNPDVVQADIEGSILTLDPIEQGETTIEILASAGFTERVDAFTVHSIVVQSLEDQNQLNPHKISLSPNPFTGETTISFELSQKSKVTLELFNYSGAFVSSLINEVKQQGKHEVLLKGLELTPGVYFCILKTNKGLQTMKMIKL